MGGLSCDIIPPLMSKRTNEEWLSDLRSSEESREAALTDLRALITKGLPYALTKYLSPNDPQFDPLIEEVAQETLLRVLEHLETFEGRSQFTTWVHKIAVRVALTELRRKRWKDVSLDDLTEMEEGPFLPGLMADPSIGPESAAEGQIMLERIGRLLMEDLTDKQRQAMLAVVIHGLPLEEVARRMGMNRNAMYKLLHDARLRLKRRVAAEGLTPQDILATFEEG